jgi:exosortase family protein XrtF
MYASYIDNSQVEKTSFQCAPLTANVANQTASLLNMFGYNVIAVQNESEMSIKLFVSNEYIARVIEGCNSMSIIILFVAFIIAFSGENKIKFIYIVVGSAIIYTINIVRISFLTIMLYKFPDEQIVLHNLVFPGIIYGTIFLLWVIWVQKFSQYKR